MHCVGGEARSKGPIQINYKIDGSRSATTSNLGRNTPNIETSTTKSPPLLNTSGFEAKLSSFNGGNVATGASTDNDDVVVIGGGGETAEGRG